MKKKIKMLGISIVLAHMVVLPVDLELVRAYQNPRVRAFLDMIAHAEGTNHDLGYRTQYTGAVFHSYHDHPRQKFVVLSKGHEFCLYS